MDAIINEIKNNILFCPYFSSCNLWTRDAGISSSFTGFNIFSVKTNLSNKLSLP